MLDSRQRRVLSLLRPGGVRQPQIQRIHGALSGVKAAGSVKLTTQLHLLQRLEVCTLLPAFSIRLHGVKLS